MTGLDVLLAVAGGIVTVLVIVGMVLITPRGKVDVYGDATDAQGAELSRAEAPRHRATAPARSQR